MNYGIEEIEQFKAPSRKPWLVLLIAVLIGLSSWLIARAFRDREHSPVVAEKAKAAVDLKGASAHDNGIASPAVKKPEIPAQKPPPVDLKTKDASVTGKVVALPSEALKKAQMLIGKGDRIGARKTLLAASKADASQEDMARLEEMLGALNVELAFLPYDMPEKVDHIVAAGDSLDKISRKYGVTVESIQIGNDLKNPNLIKAGDHLRILDADFSIEVLKSKHELLLLMNGEFFKRFKVGLGQFDKTPLGGFEVYDRIVEPVWWRPDGREIPYGHEENILGTRWMAIRATGETPPAKGYGIHGTWSDDSIGKSESAGCVRMRNKDVEELFNFVPLGTKVTIRK